MCRYRTLIVIVSPLIEFNPHLQRRLTLDCICNVKQAGTGPSRRHIQGSKIAKRLPSVKYSFTVLENRNFLKKKFSKKLHTQKKWTEWRAGAR